MLISNNFKKIIITNKADDLFQLTSIIAKFVLAEFTSFSVDKVSSLS